MKILEVQETEPGRPEGVRQRCYPRRWVASLFKSLRDCSHRIHDHRIMGREK